MTTGGDESCVGHYHQRELGGGQLALTLSFPLTFRAVLCPVLLYVTNLNNGNSRNVSRTNTLFLWS